MMARQQQIVYKCQCMKEEVTISVPARHKNEPIEFWVPHVMQAAIYLDHRNRSPSCTSPTMEYAKLPMDGPQIGTPPDVN